MSSWLVRTMSSWLVCNNNRSAGHEVTRPIGGLNAGARCADLFRSAVSGRAHSEGRMRRHAERVRAVMETDARYRPGPVATRIQKRTARTERADRDRDRLACVHRNLANHCWPPAAQRSRPGSYHLHPAVRRDATHR
jgi:hypothetical protein